MVRTRNPLRWQLLVALCTAGTAGVAHAQPAEPAGEQLPAAGAGKVSVEIAGMKHARGRIQVALFRDARGFPRAPEQAFARRAAAITSGVVEVAFDDVPSGPFAILVHHDEDGDGRMDTKLFGRPAEGYGVSRDAPAKFGPPKFEDARLLLHPGEHARVPIALRY